ncbi:MAG: polysaccharide export protein [Pedobacter sp.]|nr:MAG: polysaccharide export protein [Pedobacter sp.]
MSLFMFSCGAYKKTAYFQDLQGNTSESIKNYVEMTVQPQDVLDIRVSSLNADASALFNSTMVKEDDGYVVDQSGNISVPGLGYVQVSGLTTPQVREKLLKLVAPSLKQPAVSVKILNFKVSVMGDVLRPGVYPVASERITITEAISAAGDLNITAKRKNVTLIRETDGVRNYIAIDLTSKDLFNSPYYYLRNNDVIYAQPGNMKYAQASRSYEIGALVLSALSIAAIVFTTLVK